MSEIKLEVGKTYEVRDPIECWRNNLPTKIQIIGKAIDAFPYEFKGDDGDVYMPNGWLNQQGQSIFDLVREVTP